MNGKRTAVRVLIGGGVCMLAESIPISIFCFLSLRDGDVIPLSQIGMASLIVLFIYGIVLAVSLFWGTYRYKRRIYFF